MVTGQQNMVQLCLTSISAFCSPNKTNHDLNLVNIWQAQTDVLKVSFSTNLNIIIIADSQAQSRVMNLCHW